MELFVVFIGWVVGWFVGWLDDRMFSLFVCLFDRSSLIKIT
jgi:hypothetical protein